MGQLTFHVSSSSARSIFIFFHGPTDTSVSCGGLPLCFPGRAVRNFGRIWASLPQMMVVRTVAICTRVSFLSISITCCYYLLVFCFPAAMWNSVGVASCWFLLLLCVSTTRVSDIAVWLGQYQKRGLSTIGTLYILRVSQVQSSVRDSRDWLVVLRWRVGKVATGGHPRDRGGIVCWYRRVGRLARFGQGRGAFGTRP